jgi:hypothetical protein
LAATALHARHTHTNPLVVEYGASAFEQIGQAPVTISTSIDAIHHTARSGQDPAMVDSPRFKRLAQLDETRFFPSVQNDNKSRSNLRRHAAPFRLD